MRRIGRRSPAWIVTASALAALLILGGVSSAQARRSRPTEPGSGSGHPGAPGLLLRAFDGSGRSGSTLIDGEPFLTQWDPVGMAICLIHEPSSPDLVDYSGSVPLPDAVDSTNMVGCDRSFPAGPATFDFTAENSEHFDALAARLTNGDDEMIWEDAFLVDAGGKPLSLGGGGCHESCEGAGWKPRAVEEAGDAPDLAGYTIDSIRLVIRDSSWEIESPVPPNFCAHGCDGYVLHHHIESAWEVYGHPTEPAAPAPPPAGEPRDDPRPAAPRRPDRGDRSGHRADGWGLWEPRDRPGRRPVAPYLPRLRGHHYGLDLSTASGLARYF